MNEKRIIVTAPPGKICPKQNGGAYVNDTDAIPVPDNRYYRRLIAEGSLLLSSAPQAPESDAPEHQTKSKKTEGKR